MGLHQIQSGVEEDAPLVIDRGHPDGQMWGLVSGPQLMSGGFVRSFIPDQEANVVPLKETNFFILVGLSLL